MTSSDCAILGAIYSIIDLTCLNVQESVVSRSSLFTLLNEKVVKLNINLVYINIQYILLLNVKYGKIINICINLSGYLGVPYNMIYLKIFSFCHYLSYLYLHAYDFEHLLSATVANNGLLRDLASARSISPTCRFCYKTLQLYYIIVLFKETAGYKLENNISYTPAHILLL